MTTRYICPKCAEREELTDDEVKTFSLSFDDNGENSYAPCQYCDTPMITEKAFEDARREVLTEQGFILVGAVKGQLPDDRFLCVMVDLETMKPYSLYLIQPEIGDAVSYKHGQINLVVVWVYSPPSSGNVYKENEDLYHE